jgi:hypothetical protein
VIYSGLGPTKVPRQEVVEKCSITLAKGRGGKIQDKALERVALLERSIENKNAQQCKEGAAKNFRD